MTDTTKQSTLPTEAIEWQRFSAWVKEDRIPPIQRKHHWKTWLRAIGQVEQEAHFAARATPVSAAQSDPVFVNQLQEAIFAARSIDGREDYWNDVLARLGVTAPAKPQSDLYSAIMNLPCKVPEHVLHADPRNSYQYGCRDTRHAAAELVSAHFATTPSEGVAAPVLEADLLALREDVAKLYQSAMAITSQAAQEFAQRVVEHVRRTHCVAPAQPSADQVRDAARYRWIRQFGYQAHELIFHGDGTLMWTDDMDAAIDAAMRASSEKGADCG